MPLAVKRLGHQLVFLAVKLTHSKHQNMHSRENLRRLSVTFVEREHRLLAPTSHAHLCCFTNDEDRAELSCDFLKTTFILLYIEGFPLIALVSFLTRALLMEGSGTETDYFFVLPSSKSSRACALSDVIFNN